MRETIERGRRIGALLALAALIASSLGAPARAGAAGADRKRPAAVPTRAEAAAAERDARAKLEAYRVSLDALSTLHGEELDRAKAEVAQREALFARDLVSRTEVDAARARVALAERAIAEDRSHLAEIDEAADEIDAMHAVATAPAYTGALSAVVASRGLGRWSLADAGGVDAAFRAAFHHGLPVSAFGQTALHDRLGFDHSHAMDVAVNPDSGEGRWLQALLAARGIPFLAFRRAVPGKATGPHIHVGLPSHRIGR